jgi:hypothetical protein
MSLGFSTFKGGRRMKNKEQRTKRTRRKRGTKKCWFFRGGTKEELKQKIIKQLINKINYFSTEKLSGGDVNYDYILDDKSNNTGLLRESITMPGGKELFETDEGIQSIIKAINEFRQKLRENRLTDDYFSRSKIIKDINDYKIRMQANTGNQIVQEAVANMKNMLKSRAQDRGRQRPTKLNLTRPRIKRMKKQRKTKGNKTGKLLKKNIVSDANNDEGEDFYDSENSSHHSSPYSSLTEDSYHSTSHVTPASRGLPPPQIDLPSRDNNHQENINIWYKTIVKDGIKKNIVTKAPRRIAQIVLPSHDNNNLGPEERYSEPIPMDELTDKDVFFNNDYKGKPKIWYRIFKGKDGRIGYSLIGKYFGIKDNQHLFDDNNRFNNFTIKTKYEYGPLQGQPLLIAYKIE